MLDATERTDTTGEPVFTTAHDELKYRRDQLTGVVPFDVPPGAPQPRSITIFRLAWLEDLAREPTLTEAQRASLALPERPAEVVAAAQIVTAHFTISYDTTGTFAVSATIAQNVADDLEAALANFAAYFNVQVTTNTPVHFDATSPHYTDPKSGIHFNADSLRARENNRPSRTQTAVHECFHVWQFFVGWRVNRDTEKLLWMLEGTAVWAALKWTAAAPSIDNPPYLTYWFDHPEQIVVSTPTSKSSIGYVTLPFWMWVEGQYPLALPAFLAKPPPAGQLAVDALAAAMDPSKTMEALVCEFAGHLLRDDWCPSKYLTVQNIEQPRAVSLAAPKFVSSRSPDYMNQLSAQGANWTVSDAIPKGAIYVYHAQYQLSGQDPSRTWEAVLDLSSLTGDGSVSAYYVVMEWPGDSPDTAEGQCTVPVSRVFNDPTSADVYLVVAGNQHPPNLQFRIAFDARFQGT